MKALRLAEWQQPPQLVDVPVPDPGPGEVLIRIGGAGACHSDLHLLEWPPGVLPFEVPFTLGHENAGWVEALGAGVTGFEPGQPIAVYGPWGCGHCRTCRQGMENYCEHGRETPAAGGGLGRDGGMAEYMLVPSARLLVPLTTLEPADAAPLTDAGLTSYHALKRSMTLLVPGSTVVVIGVGGLGHMAVQMARELTGAKVVAVDLRADHLDLAKRVGADVGVQAGADAADAIHDATAGRGAEVVLDFVGSDETLALAVASARPLAHVTLVGLAGGSIPFGFFGPPYECALASTYWGSITELMEVIALAEAGRIVAHTERFPLERAVDAYERMQAATIAGRAVIVPG